MEHFFTSSIRRYYELELPEGFRRRKRRPLLIALHGYEGNKDSMMRLARRIGAGRMAVISLEGPNQFFLRRNDREPTAFPVGFGWGTNRRMEDSIALHHRDLMALISIAAREYGADRSQIFLLAFSQACAYNYRLAFAHPRSLRGVIGVCGGAPHEWEEPPRTRPAALPVLHIAASRDQWYTREKNLWIRRVLAERTSLLDFRFYNSTHRFPRRSIPYIRRWIGKLL
jgi:predicted esterase